MVMAMPRPQFTLRALLVATVAVACLLSWIGQNVNTVRQRRLFIERSWEGNGSVKLLRSFGGIPRRNELPWLRRTIGDAPAAIILYDRERDPTGTELTRAKLLFPEAALYDATPDGPAE
jgi:hypothetical protein